MYETIITKSLQMHKELLTKAENAQEELSKKMILNRIKNIIEELKKVSANAAKTIKARRQQKTVKKTKRTFKLERTPF